MASVFLRPSYTGQNSQLLEQARDSIRVKHYSLKTEQAYLRWISDYILFHKKRHPKEMGSSELSQYLSHLAVHRKVAASTQDQALSALPRMNANSTKFDRRVRIPQRRS